MHDHFADDREHGVGPGYLGFWRSYAGGLSVEHWVNDALMAIFFLLIGLELERELWNWSRIPTMLLCGAFLVIDLAFFGANIIKFIDGGWFPIALAAAVFTIMLTWKKGRSILQERIEHETQQLEPFLVSTTIKNAHRIPGTAVFMNGNASKTPPALVRNLMHNGVLHQNVIFLTVKTRQIPYVSEEERYIYEPLGRGFARVKLYFGYMEDSDVLRELRKVREIGFRFNPGETIYYLGRETIISSGKYSGMARWRKRVFSLLSRNARSATSFFGIPPNRVVELGEQVGI